MGKKQRWTQLELPFLRPPVAARRGPELNPPEGPATGPSAPQTGRSQGGRRKGVPTRCARPERD